MSRFSVSAPAGASLLSAPPPLHRDQPSITLAPANPAHRAVGSAGSRVRKCPEKDKRGKALSHGPVFRFLEKESLLLPGGFPACGHQAAGPPSAGVLTGRFTAWLQGGAGSLWLCPVTICSLSCISCSVVVPSELWPCCFHREDVCLGSQSGGATCTASVPILVPFPRPESGQSR